MKKRGFSLPSGSHAGKTFRTTASTCRILVPFRSLSSTDILYRSISTLAKPPCPISHAACNRLVLFLSQTVIYSWERKQAPGTGGLKLAVCILIRLEVFVHYFESHVIVRGVEVLAANHYILLLPHDYSPFQQGERSEGPLSRGRSLVPPITPKHGEKNVVLFKYHIPEEGKKISRKHNQTPTFDLNLSTRSSTVSRWPLRAAMRHGVQPLSSFTST